MFHIHKYRIFFVNKQEKRGGAILLRGDFFVFLRKIELWQNKR
jgi:hypothetical protein